MAGDTRPIVLHLGEAIKYNHEYYDKFATRYRVVQNEYLDRDSFAMALKAQAFGQFAAIFRPHFQSGGEMGQWDEKLISLLPPSVKIFASAGAGYNWADVDALAKRGIWYAYGANASDDAVSDTALWMILSVFRNFTRSQLAARTADPGKFMECHRTNAIISKNPKGQLLGLIGLGNISTLLVGKAKAIGMDIVYFDVKRKSPDVEESMGVRYIPFEELLAQADCVSLHVPLTQHTKHLIDAKAFSMMKFGARIINTARGEVIDEEALIDALRSCHLSAAGLDMHYHEPQVSPILAGMENVTLTTHVAGGALDTRINFELNAMKNIAAVVGRNGELVGEPLTAVNQPVQE